ncbi:arginyl-tRNA synthetase [Amycolatopsis mediterranei S699]|uniref:Arginine--tRNA ligase n=3 Tax=Amycolatopsis mediterranei TaxID=33910 RepID=A0A0H3DFK0_AMYMU|nr:arginine--tRNA ligase [Amycolatopsis mediterranei]ADJ48424.1 arginyl-tRNA synthetase [Amycolatopsis mediterranei U32]AEK45345.1 arginyl-tRNA synthetase [Amycolatopsis mediterranei S699]AFO80135.1 arginyl-tRNA synthetase [Amycolatopsis mediterranei S699]AGT87263.1 arginyl-tRNA synthetase [Amycolatopsis mediterranei RB]KDO10941.1 arginyl-tRNA synthetase [Amycolatopsis mediterranei]
MQQTADVTEELARRVVTAAGRALDVALMPEQALVQASPRDGVDYQANLAMSLGKQLGRPPREVAGLIAGALELDGIADPPEVSGPGFLNFSLRTEWLEARTGALLGDPRLGVPETTEPRRIALDYSSPNVAKEMHVGHLRSSVIGDALARLLRFAGHEVLPHNHLGDWGTPFGMLIEHLLDVPAGQRAIADLDAFYREARRKFDSDEAFATRARTRVVKLQSGDEDTLAVWQELVDESTRHFNEVYALLGISLTDKDIYGESYYNPYLATVIDDLEAAGLTEVSNGAICVFPEGFSNREGDRLPLIVRKRDGGYGYAATDLATVRYWTAERGATDLLYVVGTPQAQHFAMVFATCRAAGWLTGHAEHVGFGTVLGADGKAMRTRAGETVKLADLLTEAVTQAAAVVTERSELDAAGQAEVARAVGIGAVKYADLSGDRERDYVFAWDRMLAYEGNTSVYLQYAHARTQSLLRKAGGLPEGTQVALEAPAERALALKLLRFGEALKAATSGYAPHKLCTYLYETAVAFSRFFEECPVLKASSPSLRASRLRLTTLTSHTLALGLSLLGIEAPDRL